MLKYLETYFYVFSCKTFLSHKNHTEKHFLPPSPASKNTIQESTKLGVSFLVKYAIKIHLFNLSPRRMAAIHNFIIFTSYFYASSYLCGVFSSSIYLTNFDTFYGKKEEQFFLKGWKKKLEINRISNYKIVIGNVLVTILMSITKLICCNSRII